MLVERARRALASVEEVVEQTPDDRERHVDLVRAVAIVMVVIGHWLAVAVTETNGTLDGVNALGELSWAPPVTWVFQVMPLFFFIGGYANAASLASTRQAGGGALGWVHSRFERILLPTTVLLGVLVLAVGGARLVGVGHDTASTAAWLASVPVWFLAAYLAVLALAPLACSAHRAFGWFSVLVLVALVAAADIARLGLGFEAVGYVNYLVLWLVFHQLGMAWRSGSLPARPRVGLPMLVGGSVVAVVLTAFGPYPTSMVGVPGEELQNTAPPTLALLALGVAQIGLVLAARDRASRWLENSRAWAGVIGVNSVVLTLFLWHMFAALVAAVVLYPTGVIPVVPVESGAWLMWRPLWIVACSIVLLVLVATFGGIEMKAPGARKGVRIEPVPARAAGWLGAVAVTGALLGIGVAGEGANGLLGFPNAALGAYLIGGGLLLVAARARTGETE